MTRRECGAATPEAGDMVFTMADGYIKGRRVALELMSIGKTASGQTLYLERAAAEKYVRMEDDAAKDGVTWTINAAFRTTAEQDRLYRKYMLQLAAWEKGGRLGPRPAKAAAPGWSTHQSGLSVDINRFEGDDPKTPAPDSPVDKWLDKYAAYYGFVRDVADEPWHLSFLPDKAAKLVA